jgi:hypothetical protein
MSEHDETQSEPTDAPAPAAPDVDVDVNVPNAGDVVEEPSKPQPDEGAAPGQEPDASDK